MSLQAPATCPVARTSRSASAGSGGSLDVFARQLAEDTGLLRDVPEEVARSFD